MTITVNIVITITITIQAGYARDKRESSENKRLLHRLIQVPLSYPFLPCLAVVLPYLALIALSCALVLPP
jgi:hypothetical protein